MSDNSRIPEQGAGSHPDGSHSHPPHQPQEAGSRGTVSNDARGSLFTNVFNPFEFLITQPSTNRAPNTNSQGYLQAKQAWMANTYNNQTAPSLSQNIPQNPNLQEQRNNNFMPYRFHDRSMPSDGGPIPLNEHWTKQLTLYAESNRQRSVMTNGQVRHYYAEIFGPCFTAATDAEEKEEAEIRSRPSNMNNVVMRQDWCGMDLSGQGLRLVTPTLFKYIFLTELYIAGNKITNLPAAIGSLRQLSHLDASGNLLTSLPRELGMCVFLKTLFLFDNGILTLPAELGSLYQLEMLGIEGNPLNVAMKQEVMWRGTKSLIRRLREEANVPPPPRPRLAVDLPDHATAPVLDRFKVFSYNILCEGYVNDQQYPYAPDGALTWDYRKQQVLQELLAGEADFICLQEVSLRCFNGFFSAELAKENYAGLFCAKSRIRTMTEALGQTVDGCAIFYKRTKYVLLVKEDFDFTGIGINRPDMKGQDDIYNRVMPRDDIGLVALFESRTTGTRLIVANTHLYWNPAFPDVKLVQIAILLDYVRKFSEEYVKLPALKDEGLEPIAHDVPILGPEATSSVEYKSGTDIPLVLCSDLNSLPDSSVYELLSKGRVSPAHPDLSSYKYGLLTQLGAQHPFSLQSAYSVLDGTPDEVPYTNYTPKFKGKIDHIWYSTKTLKLTSLLGPVDPEYMKSVPGFPNYHFPSDHLSLLAEFVIMPEKDEKNCTDSLDGAQINTEEEL